MDASIWLGSLVSFCDEVAGTSPAPAAVAISAVTASFGVSLLIKVLEIAGRRKSFAGDRQNLRALIEACRRELERLKDLADEDIAAVRLYVGSENPAAARNAIEVPMRAARVAMSGLDLSVEAAEIPGLTRGLLAADLGAAARLLSTAVRAILLSVDFNLRQFGADEQFSAELAAECRDLKDRAARQEQVILRKVDANFGS